MFDFLNRLTASAAKTFPSAWERGDQLLEELQKPAEAIDRAKCLKLISDGVNLEYPNWPEIAKRGYPITLLKDMAQAVTMDLGANPTDPAAFLLACEKNQKDIVKAMIDKKIVHPFQWHLETGETGQMAAARNGHVDIVMMFQGIWESMPLFNSEKIDRIMKEPDYSRIEVVQMLGYSKKEGKEPLNNKGQTAFLIAQEAGHRDVVEAMLTDAFLRGMDRSGWRTSDPGYDDLFETHKTYVAKTLAEMRSPVKVPKL